MRDEELVMEFTGKHMKYAICLVWIILIFLTGSIFIRFFVRQIFIEGLHLDNVITKAVFFDNDQMGANIDETVTMVDWESLYPFVEDDGYEPIISKNDHTWDGVIRAAIDKYVTAVNFVKSKVTMYSEDLLVGRNSILSIEKGAVGKIGLPDIGQGADDNVVKLENGHLTTRYEALTDGDLSEIAESVNSFSNWLASEQIGFMFVNVGTKICKEDTQLPEWIADYSNDNADKLISRLNDDVYRIDFRDELYKSNLDWYESYYMTDHHWRNTTGIWAAGVLADKLNDDFGFSFNPEYFQEKAYSIEEYPDYFLGYEGRKLALGLGGLESFDRVLPKYNTNYSVSIPTKHYERRGNYKEVLFDDGTFQEIANYSGQDWLWKPDAYNCSNIRNYALININNNMQCDNDDKCVLFIQDSMGWYSTSYLAQGIGETITLYPFEFTGSIRGCILQKKPDLVVLMYSQGNIEKIDWSGHKSFWDFR